MFQVEPHATDLQFRSMPSSIARCFAYTSLFRTFLGLKWALDQCARRALTARGARALVCRSVYAVERPAQHPQNETNIGLLTLFVRQKKRT